MYDISHDKSQTCVKFPHPRISIFHTVHLNSPTSIIPSLYVSQNMVNGPPGMIIEIRSEIPRAIQIERQTKYAKLRINEISRQQLP